MQTGSCLVQFYILLSHLTQALRHARAVLRRVAERRSLLSSAYHLDRPEREHSAARVNTAWHSDGTQKPRDQALWWPGVRLSGRGAPALHVALNRAPALAANARPQRSIQRVPARTQ